MDLPEIIRNDDFTRFETFLGEIEDISDVSKEADSDGLVPIHLASLLGRAEFVKMMVNKGFDVNVANARGYTGLHIAGAWGQLETLKALVAGGANPSLVNVRRETACNIAERYGKQDCVDYLQSAEAAASFKAVISGARELLGDAERIAGKWTKDDKNKVTALCKEKWDWLTLHPDVSAEQIATHQDDFDLRFATYMSKLQPT